MRISMANPPLLTLTSAGEEKGFFVSDMRYQTHVEREPTMEVVGEGGLSLREALLFNDAEATAVVKDKEAGITLMGAIASMDANGDSVRLTLTNLKEIKND